MGKFKAPMDLTLTLGNICDMAVDVKRTDSKSGVDLDLYCTDTTRGCSRVIKDSVPADLCELKWAECDYFCRLSSFEPSRLLSFFRMAK